MTAEEFLALPEMLDVNNLLDGVHYRHKVVDAHQRVLGDILFGLRQMADVGEWRLVRTSVMFDQHNVAWPDLFWVAGAESLCTLGDDGYWHGAPDLIIEILSPGTTRQDRDVKYRLYEQSGVREYWIVEADELYIEVYVLRDGKFERQGVYGLGDEFASTALNVTLKVDALFKP